MISNILCNKSACNANLTTDIDECATGDHTCHANADCSNTDGNFTCSCSSGYSGDGMTCSG